MSVRVISQVFRHSQELLGRRLVLIVLADAAGDDGVTWLAQEKIALYAGLSRSHTNVLIQEMIADGAIEMRKAQRGRRRISVYRVLVEGLDDVEYDRLPFAVSEPFSTTSEILTSSEVAESPESSEVTTLEVLTSSEVDDVRSVGPTTLDPSVLTRARSLPLKSKVNRKENLSATNSVAKGKAHPLVDTFDVPPLTLIGGQNLGFNRLALVCSVDATNSNRAREVGSALNGDKKGLVGIRAQFTRQMRDAGYHVRPGDTFETALEAAIEHAAILYRRKLPGAILTPLALAKWWSDLGAIPERGRSDGYLTTAEITGAS